MTGSPAVKSKAQDLEIQLPQLSIAIHGAGPDAMVTLEQDDGTGQVDCLSLHPSQVRLLAERMGLLPYSPAMERDRLVRRLSRQLRHLLHRIDTLDDWLAAKAAQGHEDLEAECVHSTATWEMAREFVQDLPPDEIEPAADGQAMPSTGPEQATLPGVSP